MHQKKPKITLLFSRGRPSAFWVQILSRRYDVEFVEKVEDAPPPPPPPPLPDLFFYASHPYRLPARKNFDALNCLRVFYTGENIKPDLRFFDYAFSFEETDDRNFCLPFFARSPLFEAFRTGRYNDEIRGYRKHPKSRFCAFIYNGMGTTGAKKDRKKRMEFCRKLMSYKRVDCPGRVLNNMPPIGSTPVSKFHFMKQYKFTIAFENASSPNYVTEKIFQALLVNSVPIYWGSPRIAEYFNPEAFINCRDYDNFDRVMDRVIEVDNNDDLYRKYVDAPPILEGSRAYAVTEEAILERLDKIVDSIGVVTPVCSSLSCKLRLPFYRYGYYLAGKYNHFIDHLGCWLKPRQMF